MAQVELTGAGAVEAGPAMVSPRFGAGMTGRVVLWLGLAALVIPTLLNLVRWSWSSEAGAHGPIVLATGAWIVWREREKLRDAIVQPLFPGILGLALALPCYAVGRIANILMLESIGLYVALLTVAFLRYGGHVIRRFWFICIYALFLLTPPENWVFVATRPVKVLLSQSAVDVLAWAGFSVGSTGSMIQIDGYQLLVASACSGVNSLIGISAISLFYVYLRHDDQPRYALLLTLLLLPIALLTNFLRILGLVLVTHWFGDEAAQGLIHEASGLGTFALALALLLGIDALIFPLFGRPDRHVHDR